VQLKPMKSNGGAGDKSALERLTVLGFSHVLSGPYCTLLLSDYGATVYKIEPVDAGEAGRGWGPPFAGDQAFFFLGLNRGKLGVSIDLKAPEGIALCHDLIKKVDIVIANFRPGTMERLGLGYEELVEINPRLIYCSISGYGRTGPLREGPAMDLIVQCASGLLDITGTPAGERVRAGYSVTDVTAGLFAVIGILMAVRHRDRSGQLVDVSMYDAIISAMRSNLMGYLGSGQVSRPLGTGFPNIVPYRVYQAMRSRLN
jgi:crotonobetainyl-CoA:carnitine CoA-transferase CaiB-like acyl-CoA transferase